MAYCQGFGQCKAWFHHPIYAAYWKQYEAMQKFMFRRQYYEIKAREAVDLMLHCESNGIPVHHHSAQSTEQTRSRCCGADSVYPDYQSTAGKSRHSQCYQDNCNVRQSRSNEERRIRNSCRRDHIQYAQEEYAESRRPSRIQESNFTEPEENLQNDDPEEEEECMAGYEYVITDEFREFLHENEKYRKERDSQRNKEEDVEYVDISTISVDGLPKIGRPNLQEQIKVRKELMKQWYGKDAEIIEEMENTVQAKFNEFRFKNNPSMWPNIPVRIKFN